jgi:DNA repair exonuclease SbcCD ATPase subunit
MATIEEMRGELRAWEVKREEKQKEIDNFEPDESEWEESYQDMLDECYPAVFGLYPSRILQECDPIQYNMGLSEYVDSLEYSEMPDYQKLEEELEEIEQEIEEIESDITDLESEIEELEGETE